MAEQKQGIDLEDRERTRVAAAELSWALRAVTRANTAVEHALAHRLRLRPLDYDAMMHLMDADDPIGPAELGERVGISSGSATELVDRLERDGHLVRSPHPRDRRRIVLEPTDDSTGRQLQELKPLLAGLDELAGEFNERERSTIERYLRGVARRMEDYIGAELDPQRDQAP